MTTADKIVALIEQAKPLGAIVFNGSEPRLIGTAANVAALTLTELRVLGDAAMRDANVCATYVSRAQVGGQLCIVCHG